MPETTVNVMWLGNRPLLDSSPTTNITQTQANAINGWTAEGQDQLKAVALTGTSYTSGGSHFYPTYNPISGSTGTPSPMSFTDPATGAHITGAHINTFVNATYRITVHDANGNPSIVQQSGVLIQLSTGDIFFRPSATSLPAWSDIHTISKVEVVSVTPNNNTVATIGFTASIFDMKIVCFVRGTMIECIDGPRSVEDLQIGDLVRTADNGFRPIRWVGAQRLTSELVNSPNLLPIRIRAGALGENIPSRDLLVSPQHRVLVRSKIAIRLFGTAEVLVAAKQLLQLDGIDIEAETTCVDYFHFSFDRHEVVYANGAQAESLYPGKEALLALGKQAREELYAIFPELLQGNAPEAARSLLSGRQARLLTVRHLQHDRPMISAIEQ